jgi:hypothetical protein
METGSPRRETVEQLVEEFVEQYRRGERPSLSDYTERFPDHAEPGRHERRRISPFFTLFEGSFETIQAGARSLEKKSRIWRKPELR